MKSRPNRSAELPWTGERYVPELEGEIRLEHVHRYLLAREITQGKDVLDIACGEGYGSNLLAEVANSVIGVDISPETIDHAQSIYQKKNLDFKVGSCAQIPLADASVDLVVSFETIEHHNEHEQMMREIKRTLRPGGLLILSTPNKREYTDASGQRNQFHVKELYREDLEKLLRASFKNVALYGQRVQTGSYSAPLSPEICPAFKTFSESAEKSKNQEGILRPLYLIALSSDEALPILSAGLLEGENALTSKDAIIQKLTKDFESRSQWAQSLDKEIESSRASYQKLQSEFLERTEWAERLDAELAALREKLSASEEELRKRGEQGHLLEQELEKSRNLYQQLRHEYIELNKDFESRSQWAQSLDKEIESSRASYQKLQSEFLERTEWAERLDAELAALREKLSASEEELRKRGEQGHLLEQELEKSRNLYQQLRHEYIELNKDFESRSQWAQSLDKEIESSRASYQKLQSEFLERTEWAKRLDEELKSIQGSTSWKLTCPLRYCGCKMRELGKRAAEGFHFLSKKLYHKLPFSPRIKWRLRRLFYQLTRGNEPPHISQATPVVEMPKDFSDLKFTPLFLRASQNPAVTIVIPVYNNCEYTFQCLKSIAENTTDIDYEVLVVDDCSTDRTREMLAVVSTAQVLRNKKNSGFLFSCNSGAKKARGEYIVFLNNDTVVTPRWLEELLETFKAHPEAGLVGSKLLYPDGRLQEAGGIIWRDASGWNYGRLDDPQKPEYNYLREVDYCSGACVMVPKKLFMDLGGFDKRYAPAYAEDADLAFQIRQAGRKVFYQPLSQIIHFEGISSGTDLSSGVKKYQLINQEKFQKKWASVLQKHRPNGENPDFEKERSVQKRILVIDACTLTPDQDAGSLTVFNHLKIFQSLGYKVAFIPNNLVYIDRYTADIQRMGVECLYQPYIGSIEAHLRKHGPNYDAVMLCRPYVADAHIDAVRKHCPKATVIFDTEDLHFIREQRHAELEKNQELDQRAAATKKQELLVAAKADYTIVVNPLERDVLLAENPALNVAVIQPPREIYGTDVPFDDRNGIVFIGGFQHTPNVDAALYFVKDILPHVRARLGNVKFYVIGSRPTEAILSLASENIIVTGYVSDLEPYFKRCRVSVAPIRYGAGIKCKILTSLSHGVPVVATSLACEGMGLEHGNEVLIADEPEDFAEELEALYSHRELWQRISKNGLDAMQRQYSFEAARETFKRLLTERNAPVAA